MDNLEKISNIIDKRLKLSLETLKVKDLLEIGKLNYNEEIISDYLDMSVIHFLSLVKLNRLYENKKIDADTYIYLKCNLKKYYEIKQNIAEIEYISYISDNINIDNIISNYVELLSSIYRILSRHNIIFDPIDDKMSDIIVRGIDDGIKNKKIKIKKNK